MQYEPILKKDKKKCPYCGDNFVNHAFYYFSNLISIPLDNYLSRLFKYVPNFVKKFADTLTLFLIKILEFCKFIKFSNDMNKANSFRSRIIWEEAERRGIKMEQLILLGKYLELYKARIKNKYFYFESLPIDPFLIEAEKNWDDKIILKDEFKKHGIQVPNYCHLPFFFGNYNNKKTKEKIEKIFNRLKKPIIVKPRSGSLGRHTIININTLEHFIKAIKISKQICPYLVMEEHLEGGVHRATLINGKLVGFQQANSPFVIGNGKKTILELIQEKDNSRPERVESVDIGIELYEYIERSGFTINDVLPKDYKLRIHNRFGRLWGGTTKEMIDEVHPSFATILEKAAKITSLPIIGFDCIINDPTKNADSQRWGIIECNSLPFIDLHYYTLEGKPRNIAGMIWDLYINPN